MVDRQILRRIRGTSKSASITMLVTWVDQPNFSEALKEPDRATRSRAVSRAVAGVKKDVLHTLHSIEGVSVNDMPGVTQAIVTAPPAAWRKVFAVLGPDNKSVEFHANAVGGHTVGRVRRSKRTSLLSPCEHKTA
jgi:hypothetical protein